MNRGREEHGCNVPAELGSILEMKRLETRTASARNETEGLGMKHGELRWPDESASVVEAVSP
ncbi:MAG: hypothetical protein ACUVQQ_14605 [Thermogutta sp.]